MSTVSVLKTLYYRPRSIYTMDKRRTIPPHYIRYDVMNGTGSGRFLLSITLDVDDEMTSARPLLA